MQCKLAYCHHVSDDSLCAVNAMQFIYAGIAFRGRPSLPTFSCISLDGSAPPSVLKFDVYTLAIM